MKVSYLLLFSCILISSCKKEKSLDYTVIKGEVIEYFTQKPLGGVDVHVRYFSDFISLKTRHLTDTLTSEQGEYYFKFDKIEDIGEMYMEIYSPVQCNDKRNCSENFQQGEINEINFEVFTIATLNLKLFNELKTSLNDSIYVELSENSIFDFGNKKFRYQVNDSLTIPVDVYGNDTTIIYWKITNNEGLQEYSEQVLINDFDTVDFLIKF